METQDFQHAENQFHDQEYYPAEYAGFWLRFAAYIIDALIISVIWYALVLILGIFGVSAMGGLSAIESMEDPDPAVMAGILAGTFTLAGVMLIGVWLYYALMESGHNQATLGKMAVGIKVTDMDGNRISFLRATGRHFGKIISAMILYIGFIMAGLTDKKQALHDMMASCLVIKK